MGSQTKTKTCACKNETEQEKLSRIAEVIEEYRDREGSLIQILHLAQGIYGCLPLNVQRFIAERLDIPLSKVSGVVSFYSFSLPSQEGKTPSGSVSVPRVMCAAAKKSLISCGKYWASKSEGPRRTENSRLK